MPVYKERDSLQEKISDTFKRRIYHLDKLMLVICDFTGGPASEPDPPHSHPHEQITYVAEGEVEFYKGSEVFRLSEGDLIILPGGVPHCIRTLTSYVKLIDSFSPIRNEFIKL